MAAELEQRAAVDDGDTGAAGTGTEQAASHRNPGRRVSPVSDAPMPAVSRRLLAAIVGVCLTVAVANLLGWIFGIGLFISIRPGLPAMVPATALLSLLTTCGLWAQRQWPERFALAAAWPVAVITLGLAIESCYVAGGAPAPFQLAHSGHESIFSLSSWITAGMFVVLGYAVLMLAGRERIKTAQALGLAVFLLAILNLSGYLFRDTVLFHFLPGRGTSILTTLQAILLSIGVLVARPREGLMAAVTGPLPSARISRRLLLSAFLVPIAAGGAVVAASRAGLYDTGTALPLFVWFVVVILTLIIWRFALQLGEADLARSHAQRALQGALEELRAEQDRKDIFLATLAHELRNPLAPISAAAEVLKHGGATGPEDRQRLGTIVAGQVGHIVDLVNDLMDIERVSRGRLALDKQVLDIRVPIAAAYEQVRPLVERKRHQCRLHLPAHAVHVCGEHRRLVQVVANLLNNAAKYTAAGGTIDVWLAEAPRQVEIVVEDNGIGIAPDLLQRVFDTFTQAALTPDRAEGGLGLGLALVKRLTELHGGSVSASSAGPGTGSTFTLVLPRVTAGTRDAAPKKSPG